MPMVTQNEIEPCAGVVVDMATAKALDLPRMDGVCRSRIPLRIAGYDKRWRCPDCNRIHLELVYADTRQQDNKVHV